VLTPHKGIVFATYLIKLHLMKKYIIIIPFLILAIACKTKQPMTQQDLATASRVQELIENRKIDITATWAYPLASNVLNQLAVNNGLGAGNSGSRINLLGNGNFLKIHNDSVSAYLPYYGERRMGGGYNTSNGVEFSGIPKSFEITKDKKTDRTEMKFSISQDAETYEVFIEFFNTKKVQISVNSVQRSSIRYDGFMDLDTE
tara:strand:- start:29800 stop:30405 length:606 start_codon:yes stop_codon:yes gene_type:complete